MRRLSPLLVLTAVLTALALLLTTAPAAAAPALPTGSRWPLDGSVRVLRGFDPPAERWGAGHRGLDLAAAVGQPVRAAAAGRVSFAGMLAGRGVVVVDHGDLRTTYEPVRASVRVGAVVTAGQALGTLTSGSHCSRACLHWGLKDGDTYLDPTLLGGAGALAGPVRLVAGAERAEAEQRATERAAQQEVVEASLSAGIAHLVGPGGGHGFLAPAAGGITSPYGRRFHPVLHVWKLHDGTDFGAGCGAPIVAPADGRVFGGGPHPAYGNRLFLDHGVVDGRVVRTGYNHAIRYTVSTGERVRRGQVIGYVGTTGYSTGCHLHLMVWLDGRLVDPMSWF